MLLVRSHNSSKMTDNLASRSNKISIASRCKRVFTSRRKPGWVLKIVLLWRPFPVATRSKVQLSNVDAVRVYVYKMNSWPISVHVLKCNKMVTFKLSSALTNLFKLMVLRISNFLKLRKRRWTTWQLSLRWWCPSLVIKMLNYNNKSHKWSHLKYNLATCQCNK